MIVDCFTFFDELDLLELRLETLAAVVDRFVLCEAPFTFRGQPKPLVFAQQRERFARWRERIVHLVYPQPANGNPWLNEWGQRDHLAAGLTDLDDDALVLIGDCDEIPDPALVARRPSPGRILAHRQRYSAGYVNRVTDEAWIGTRTIARRDIARYGSLSNVRKQPRETLEFVDGGWHFTSLGGPAAQARKFRSASHAEVDLPYFYDLRKLEVTFAAEGGGRQIPIDASFPEPVRTDARWARYVWDGPALTDPAEVAALEHAHGLFAYVPEDAAGVAVLAAEPAGWETAGRARSVRAGRGYPPGRRRPERPGWSSTASNASEPGPWPARVPPGPPWWRSGATRAPSRCTGRCSAAAAFRPEPPWDCRGSGPSSPRPVMPSSGSTTSATARSSWLGRACPRCCMGPRSAPC